MSAHRSKVLSLYKALMRESMKFSGYNYRMYFIRRTQDAFREHKDETDPEKIDAFIEKAEHNLQMIKRQTTIQQLYDKQTLVIEHKTENDR